MKFLTNTLGKFKTQHVSMQINLAPSASSRQYEGTRNSENLEKISEKASEDKF